MKKLVYLSLFVLIIAFANISKVEAKVCGVKFTHSEISAGVGYNVGNKNYSAPGRVYTAIINGKKVQAICLDPESAGPGDNEYCLEDMEGEAADAMQYIYEKGSPLGGASEFATMLASRLAGYNTGISQGNGSIIGETDIGVYKTTAELLANGFYDDYIKTGDTSKLYSSSQSILLPNGDNTLREALQLYQEAMKYSSSGGGDSKKQVSLATIKGADGKGSNGKGHQRMVILGEDATGGFEGDGVCEIVDGKYYDSKGKVTTPEKFMTECCDEVDYDKLSENDKKIYEEYCDSGDDPNKQPCIPETKVNFPNACDESTTGEITESNRFLSCIVDNADYLGLDYETNITDSNPYCTVYCKEDYFYTFPGAQYDIPSGYYFKLSDAKIEGTRTCVTAKIGVEKFEAKMKQLNTDILAAHKEWSKATKALSNIKYDTKNGCIASRPGCRPSAGNNCQCGPQSCPTKEIPSIGYEYYELNSKGTEIEKKGDNVSAPLSGGCGGSCDKLCTPPANYEQIYGDMAAKAKEKYDSLVQERKEQIDLYRACSAWQDKDYHTFEPVLDYEYEEDKYNAMLNPRFKPTDSEKPLQVELCKGEVTDEGYNCQGELHSSKVEDWKLALPECTAESCEDKGDDNKYAKYYYMKQISEKARTYNLDTKWYTQIPTGEVTTGGGNNKVEMVDYSLPGNDQDGYSYFPVLITQERLNGEGLYKFYYRTSGNGQYNQGDAPGRFDEIYNKYNGVTGPMEYACEYEKTDELCFYCPPEIEEIDKGGMNYFYRPISTNDVFPNSVQGSTTGKSGIKRYRNVGENWTTDKGKATQTEIETNSGKSSDMNEIEPEYSYLIDAGNMKKTRQYNHLQEALGYGYNDFNLTCSEVTGGGGYYTCPSLFLAEGEANKYFTDLIANNKRSERLSSKNKWTGSINITQGPAWK